MEMVRTGKRAVALERQSGATVLRFEFSDAPAMTLLIEKDNAVQIAAAIASQYQTAPPLKSN